MRNSSANRLLRRTPQVGLAIVALIFAATCSGSASEPPTPTSIRSADTEPRRIAGVFPASENTLLWVTDTSDILVSADDIASAHPFTLRRQQLTLRNSGAAAVVNDDQTVLAIPVQTSGGSSGVALVRSDGYKMALHLYGGASTSIESIKFMPELGLTLLGLGDEAGDRLIAINNYGMRQFDLPVIDSLGTLRYSPDELGYMVIDRRPLQPELELVPLDSPGESTLFRGSGTSEEESGLYASLAASIASWR